MRISTPMQTVARQVPTMAIGTIDTMNPLPGSEANLRLAEIELRARIVVPVPKMHHPVTSLMAGQGKVRLAD